MKVTLANALPTARAFQSSQRSSFLEKLGFALADRGSFFRFGRVHALAILAATHLAFVLFRATGAISRVVLRPKATA